MSKKPEYDYTVTRQETTVTYCLYRDGVKFSTIRVCPVRDVSMWRIMKSTSCDEKRIGYQLEAAHELAKSAIKMLIKFERVEI